MHDVKSDLQYTHTHYSTFHHVLLWIDEDSRMNMVVDFEHLQRLKSDKIEARVFKLLDAVHLIPLHHDLLLPIHLSTHTFYCSTDDEPRVPVERLC